MVTRSSSLFLLCIVLCGCTTTADRTISGIDFDETKVKLIQKGVTRADGVVKLYGEPDSKEIVAANQVMWHYTYLDQFYINHGMFTMMVEQTTGFKKTLDILFQNDTVVNFAYVKAPIKSENTQ